MKYLTITACSFHFKTSPCSEKSSRKIKSWRKKKWICLDRINCWRKVLPAGSLSTISSNTTVPMANTLVVDFLPWNIKLSTRRKDPKAKLAINIGRLDLYRRKLDNIEKWAILTAQNRNLWNLKSVIKKCIGSRKCNPLKKWC